MKMRRVLIVDDKEENLYLLRVLLQGNGYSVDEAHHGAEALEKARSNTPDLIVTDILMPVMDGFTLCREWKKDERLRSIPLVFYTATYTDERDRQFALSLGADRFVVKPQEPDAFLAMIGEVVEQIGSRRAERPEPAAPSAQLPVEPVEEDAGYLKQYSEALVRRLEAKMEQLERTNKELQQDIAKRRETEVALRRERDFSDAVFNSVPGVLYCYDESLRLLRWNRNLEQSTGYSSGELAGMSPLQFFAGADRDLIAARIREVFDGGTSNAEADLLSKDGTRTPYYFTGMAAEIEGKRRLIGAGIDISASRRATEALRESEALLNEVGQIAGVGGWEMDLVTHEAKWTLALYEIAEIESGSPVPGPDEHVSWYLPEYQPVVDEAMRALIEEDKPLHFEAPVHTAKGKLIWVRVLAKAIREDGRCVKVKGTLQDITVRKQAEDALRESEAKYRLLVDNAGEAVYVIQDGAVVFANAAFSRWLGYDGSEAIGMAVGDLVSQDYLAVLREHERLQDEGGAIDNTFEIKVRTRGGVEIWVSETSVPIVWDGRRASLNLATDITERKRALAALEAERHTLDLVTRNIGAGLAIISKDYRTVWANDVLKRMFGDVEGKSCHLTYNQRETLCPDCGVRRVFEEGEELAVHEQSGKDANGETIWSQIVATPIRDERGEVTQALELVVPITERKRAELALQENEALLNEVGQIARIGGWEMDLIARTAKWTRVTYDIVEIEPGEPAPGPDEHVDYYLPEDRPLVVEAMRALIEDGMPLDFEARLRTAKGNIKWCRAIGEAVREGSRCVRVKGTFQDVTDRKQAEDALRESEAKYRLLHESMRDAFIAVDMEGRIQECNPAYEALVGYPKDELVRMSYMDLTPERWWDFEARIVKEQILARGYSDVYEKEYRRKDGTVFPIELRAVVIRDADGRPTGMWGTVRDITERKQALAALQQSEARFRSLVEVAPECIFVHSDNRFIFVNPAALKLFGGERREDLLGTDLVQRIAPEYRSVAQERIQLQRETGKPVPLMDQEYLRLDGTRVPVETTAVPIRFQDRDAFMVLARDVTSRRQAEEALREREEFLSSVIENIPDMVFIKDAKELKFVRLNKAGERLLGATSQDLLGKSDYDFFPEEQADAFTKMDREVLESGQLQDAPEEPIETPAGKRILHTKKLTISDKSGKPKYLLGISEDITEQKRAEADREKLRAQLIQSQKMEAVGRLAGGVAHDFNNMLGVIIGYAELALHQVAPEQPLHANLQEILKAAERSADLTRQLLAFARKQTVSPRVLDLNATVEGLLKMLRRLIGEDIDLAWIPGQNVWPVKMDPSQLDQILANLCVNARDAIAGVGKVTIGTGSVTFDEAYCTDHPGTTPGDYVLLAVSDDGCGIDPETMSRIFEPFFTTKELGKGTGLGLSTVYGIVQQNEGFINVYSELGQGTTFKIYLPREVAKADQLRKEALPTPVTGGHETILLVEDEPAILRLTTTMLQRQGYAVLAASRPGEAIQIAREHPGEIHLLVTDVVMPEMNGRAMAKNLMALYPGLKRLFMSGYTANVIAHRGVLDEGVHFIQKPFSMPEFAAKVREALDSN